MNRAVIIVLLYIISQCFVKAQDTVFIYYDANWWETTKENVYNNRKAYHTDKNTWIVTGNYDNGHIQMKSEYNDKLMKEKNGMFAFYYENGTIQTKGEYLVNKKNGKWTSYYENGKIKSEEIYVNDEKNGKSVLYFENGNIEEEGEYTNDKKNGYWISYCEEGYKFSRTKYENGKYIEVIYWNSEGKEISVKEAEVMPEFPGGMNALEEFIYSNVHYPRVAKENGIHGTVKLKFYIDKDGIVTDIDLSEGVGGGCDEEAMRVVKMMPKWKPGMQCNKPIRVLFNIPIKFTLRSY